MPTSWPLRIPALSEGGRADDRITLSQVGAASPRRYHSSTRGRRNLTDKRLTDSNAELRKSLLLALVDQGFDLTDERSLGTFSEDKNRFRNLQSMAVVHRIARAEKSLSRHESKLLLRFARGDEVVPEQIVPRLRLVERRSEDELLFRYATLIWSVPVSSGYGRRLRFLVEDSTTGKLMGIIGLGDPVMNLGCRDAWIGWPKERRNLGLQYVLDAFVLGSVPPYSAILGGKTTAVLVAAKEVRDAFQNKYGGKVSLIKRRELAGSLALITTASALGRSSVYNRLTLGGRKFFHPVGYTKGYGDFQFFNGHLSALASAAKMHRSPSAKHPSWGTGFRNRRETVKLGLAALGLSDDLFKHGIGRQVFCVPLGTNTREFLRGESDSLGTFEDSAESLGAQARDRWMVPRANRDDTYTKFDPESLRRWG